ncbi:hypothetical protein ABZ726_13570 [Streptomyces hundungensis]|uniref:hypothetical protein n=1 Tax=Streptomyces hundungensis TaxID=1077946 RepID=UPI0033C26B5F
MAEESVAKVLAQEAVAAPSAKGRRPSCNTSIPRRAQLPTGTRVHLPSGPFAMGMDSLSRPRAAG